MLPTVDAVYPAAKAVFSPWLRYGLRWTIEGESNIPTQGPVILASNHISYLDPLTLAYVADRRGRRIRFLAKAELFRDPRARATSARRAPDPGAPRFGRRRRVRCRPRSPRSAGASA